MTVMPPKLKVMKALQALIVDGTGKPCGLGAVPPGEVPPFTILYPDSGDGLSAPALSGAWDEADWDVLLKYVTAKDDREALWLQQKGQATLLDRNEDGSYVHELVVEGWKVTRRYVEDAGRDSEGAIVSLVERYALKVTPA